MNIFEFLVLLVGALLSVVFLSLLERKILSIVQTRVGPNSVLMGGLLQSVIDAFKLFLKEQMLMKEVYKLIYFLNPVGMVVLSLSLWMLLPISGLSVYFSFGVLLLVVILGLESYFLLFMGWFSSNKYSLLGGMRGVAQVISYEIVLFLLLLSFMVFEGDYSVLSMVDGQKQFSSNIWVMFYFFPLLYLVILSEMNRSPSDLLEGESELVSGFNVEYMSFGLSIIFISEFSKMVIGMFIIGGLFFSKYLILWGLMMSLVILFFRASFPRFRYDKLMLLCWMMILPLAMGLFFMFSFF